MKGWQGLCIALTLVVVGCKAAPESAFSHDGKWIAYSNAGNGITVAETANPAHRRFYNVTANGFEWSNTGRYLVWGIAKPNDQPSKWKVSVLDVQTKRLKVLPVHMIAPFIWSKDDSTLQGFALEGPVPKNSDASDLGNVKQVDFDIHANKKIGEHVLGHYFPIAKCPSGDLFLIGPKQTVARLHGTTITPLDALKNLKGNPSGFSADDRILVTHSLEGYGANKATYVDDQAHEENIPLPPGLTSTSNNVPRLEDISRDTKWLVTWREAELTKPLRRGKKRLRFRVTYSVMSRKSGRALEICSALFGEHETSPGTSANWSDDGRYLCLGVAPDDKRDKPQMWLIDLKNWAKRKLPLESW